MNSNDTRLQRLKDKGLEEFHRFTVMFLYLWLVFALFVLNEFVILGRAHNHLALQGFAIVNAAVLAKVMLIGEDLKLGRRFEHRPLFWSVLYKSCLFALVFIVFHFVEQTALGLFAGKPLTASLPSMGDGSWAGVASTWGIIAVSLLPFFALREISRVLGKDVLWSMMFRQSAKEAQWNAGRAANRGDDQP